ncbi:MAG: phosphoribosyltransferase [Cyanobacteriota bacterium]
MQPPYPLWVNRYAAGLALAEIFSKGDGISTNTLLLALPRGGVPVAAAMARQLNLPLATWSVRKIADPAQSEVAIGAIAAGGTVGWRDAEQAGQWAAMAIRHGWLQSQQKEMARRQHLFGDPAPEQLHNRHLIVVDDGIATGMTAKAALLSLGKVDAASLSLAIPVIDSSVAQELAPLVDRLEALAYVADLSSVGLWYQHFTQLSDSEVLEYLDSAEADNPSPAFLHHSPGLPAV